MPPLPRRLVPLFRSAVLALLLMTLIAALSPARAGGVAEAAMARVLVVRSGDAQDRFLGSAFLWGDGRLAVTNAHVTGEAAQVRLVDEAGHAETARVIARDSVRDVAVLAVAPGRAGFTPGPAPALGDPVWALGAPLGLGFTVTRGIVSARPRQVEAAVPLRLLQHDAAVNPGSSGGPLLDAQGRLIGMNSRIADGSRMYVGMSFAIATADLDRIVRGLTDGSLRPMPSLGLLLRPVSPGIAGALGLPEGGALVDRVAAGGIADAAGLVAGDVIAATEGQPLPGPGDLAFAIEAGLARGSLSLTLRRAGAPVEVMLTFPPAPALTVPSESPEREGFFTFADLGVTLDDTATVTALPEDSAAALSGLAPGDRILRLNGQATDAARLRAFRITAPALVLIRRGGDATLHLLIDPWDKGAGFRPVGGANVLDPAVVVF